MSAKPIALSCGEPAGIGPEISIKARIALGSDIPFFWIGDAAHLPGNAKWQAIKSPEEALRVAPDHLPVLQHDFPQPARPGLPMPGNAAAVIDVIARAVQLVRDGHASALVTAPINKKALKEGAGFAFPGHTELLAYLAGVRRVVMMLASETSDPPLRVVPATIHIPLKAVASTLTATLLEETIRITHAGMVRDFGISAPRLAVAGLNPHAGEGGQMGDEELAFIIPLLDRLRKEGLAITGPHPADTMFHRIARGGYDAAVAMYHDQALIPIKTLDFSGGVNVTLGLPFIRTSPDHGTAFDIAGKWVADADSLVAALRLAQTMARRRVRTAASHQDCA